MTVITNLDRRLPLSAVPAVYQTVPSLRSVVQLPAGAAVPSDPIASIAHSVRTGMPVVITATSVSAILLFPGSESQLRPRHALARVLDLPRPAPRGLSRRRDHPLPRQEGAARDEVSVRPRLAIAEWRAPAWNPGMTGQRGREGGQPASFTVADWLSRLPFASFGVTAK